MVTVVHVDTIYVHVLLNTILMVSGINSATHQLKNNKIPVHCILRKRYPYDCFMVTIQSLLTALMSLTEL